MIEESNIMSIYNISKIFLKNRNRIFKGRNSDKLQIIISLIIKYFTKNICFRY